MDKRPPGRPRLYQSPADFDAMVNLYAKSTVEAGEPLTWTGLALFLGFSSRQSIDEYLNYDGFSDSVKRAKLIVEAAYEKQLVGGKPVGAIFALKNFGWKDKQEHDLQSSDGSMSPKEPTLTTEQALALLAKNDLAP